MERIFKMKSLKDIMEPQDLTRGKITESSHTSGEGNGNPLQYSCLENAVDSGAWWAAVYGVAKSQTRLKRLSSSSSSHTSLI